MSYKRGSTTSAVDQRTIRAARLGQVAQPPEGGRLGVGRRTHRTPVTVTLQFCPGAEPWVRVSGPGGYWWIRGAVPLWEVTLGLTGWLDAQVNASL